MTTGSPSASVSATNSNSNIDQDASQLIKEFLPKILNELKELRTEVKEIKEENEQLKLKLQQQQKTVNNMSKKIADLECQINERERHSRSWNLVWLTKKDEEKNENTDALVHSLLNRIH